MTKIISCKIIKNNSGYMVIMYVRKNYINEKNQVLNIIGL